MADEPEAAPEQVPVPLSELFTTARPLQAIEMKTYTLTMYYTIDVRTKSHPSTDDGNWAVFSYRPKIPPFINNNGRPFATLITEFDLVMYSCNSDSVRPVIQFDPPSLRSCVYSEDMTGLYGVCPPPGKFNDKLNMVIYANSSIARESQDFLDREYRYSTIGTKEQLLNGIFYDSESPTACVCAASRPVPPLLEAANRRFKTDYACLGHGAKVNRADVARLADEIEHEILNARRPFRVYPHNFNVHFRINKASDGSIPNAELSATFSIALTEIIQKRYNLAPVTSKK